MEAGRCCNVNSLTVTENIGRFLWVMIARRNRSVTLDECPQILVSQRFTGFGSCRVMEQKRPGTTLPAPKL